MPLAEWTKCATMCWQNMSQSYLQKIIDEKSSYVSFFTRWWCVSDDWHTDSAVPFIGRLFIWLQYKNRNKQREALISEFGNSAEQHRGRSIFLAQVSGWMQCRFPLVLMFYADGARDANIVRSIPNISQCPVEISSHLRSKFRQIFTDSIPLRLQL